MDLQKNGHRTFIFYRGSQKTLANLRSNMLSSVHYNSAKTLENKILFNGRNTEVHSYIHNHI